MIPMYKFEFMDMGDLVVECVSLAENQNAEFAYGILSAIFLISALNIVGKLW